MLGIPLLLQMATSGDPDREILVCDELRWTTAELDALSARVNAVLARHRAGCVAYIGVGGAMLPLLMFGAARAGVMFAPLNYRLSPAALLELIARLPEPLVVVDPEYRAVAGEAYPTIDTEELLAAASGAEPAEDASTEAGDTAVLLFTSGTTSRPKAVELSHGNLVSYVTGNVEFLSAAPDDAALIAVPPYHIAGVSAACSNLYAGRRMVYLPRFDARRWIQLVTTERITTATVVPTMLERIISALEADHESLPTLRNLAYGGAKVGQPLVRRALELLPDVGFVNAYGLTETSSTIAVLTPEDHRSAHGSTDPVAARRLGSVGRPVPGVEIAIRAEDGRTLGSGETGELFVRGDQVSGRYAESGSALDDDGWFPTRDRATVDGDGYLYVLGRADDTIIRGGENIAPAELEDVLVEHPAVHQAVVVGADDPEWGQIIVAAIVAAPGAQPDPDELRRFVRQRLRGSRTPDRVVFFDQLPTTDTGKIVRREILAQLGATEPSVRGG